MSEEVTDPVATLTQSMAKYMDLIAVITQASLGLRAQLEREGFSPTMAEQIAGSFHIELMHNVMSGRRK
jgi:hypothetical protein